jgi:hypothetical protein
VVVVVAVDVVHVHGGVREGQALDAVDVHGGLPHRHARAPRRRPGRARARKLGCAGI